MMNTAITMQAGDALWRLKHGVKHWGIFLGSGAILQISPGAQPHIVSLEAFRKNVTVHIVRSDDADRPVIIARAYEVLQSPIEYSWWRNNCQHLKNYVLSGRAYSEDINFLAVALTMLGLAAVISRRA